MRAFILLAICLAFGNAQDLSQKGIETSLPEAGGSGGTSGTGGIGGGTGMNGGVRGGIGGVQGGLGGSGGPGGASIGGGLGGSGGIAPTGTGGDLFMLVIHQLIQVNGMDPMRVPNQQLPFSKKFLVKTYRGTLNTYGTVMYGLHNLVRTGPCFVTVDDNGMRLGLNLGISHVLANSSATIKFNTGEKHKVRVLVYVKRARAVLEIAQVSATQIQVTNFKIKELRGFDLRIRPVGKVPRAFRNFLRAVQTFVELTVKKRLEPIVRETINVQIQRLLFELSQQARNKPRPQDILGLPPRSRDEIPDVSAGGNEISGQQSPGQNKL